MGQNWTFQGRRKRISNTRQIIYIRRASSLLLFSFDKFDSFLASFGTWQFFDRTVNPISTRGQILPTTVLQAPLDIQTLRRPGDSKTIFCYKSHPNLSKNQSYLIKSLCEQILLLTFLVNQIFRHLTI